jgi:hypothetical protein
MNDFGKRVAFSLVLCALIAAGCGGSDSKSYSQQQKDEDTIWAFSNLLSNIWNSNIAGTPAGTKDITATQSDGGSVRITGTVQSDGSRNLTFTFTNYRAVVQGSAVRATLAGLNGELMSHGSPSSAIAYSCDGLGVSASLERDGYDPATFGGPLTLLGAYSSAGFSGTVNGRAAVSHETSSGGTGAGDCDAYVIRCGQVINGVEVVGGIVPTRCNDNQCPTGTTKSGQDTVTPGGPYNICTCS